MCTDLKAGVMRRVIPSNVAGDWSIHDPSLTSLGRQQAAMLPLAYPDLYDTICEQAGVIMTSPLRRTVQTTLLGFPKLKETRVRLEIWPDLYVQSNRD